MRIQTLTLYTPDLDQQEHFYTEVLGLPANRPSADELQIRAGASELIFKPSVEPYYYHFAFNIPPYQYEAALAWLKSRVPVLSDGETELIDFSNWNAYAMYFEDAGGNILEFIARRDLDLPEVSPFGANGIASVSEIGLSVPAVGKAFEYIHRMTGIPFYSGNRSNFCAAGDPEGLLIIVGHADKDWYPTDRPARLAPLEVLLEQEGRQWALRVDKKGRVEV